MQGKGYWEIMQGRVKGHWEGIDGGLPLMGACNRAHVQRVIGRVCQTNGRGIKWRCGDGRGDVPLTWVPWIVIYYTHISTLYTFSFSSKTNKYIKGKYDWSKIFCIIKSFNQILFHKFICQNPFSISNHLIKFFFIKQFSKILFQHKIISLKAFPSYEKTYNI